MYYGKHRTQGIRKKSILYPTSQNHNILAFSNIFLIFCLILFYILIVNICYTMLSHFSRVRLCATPETAAH